ncbi:MAG: molybdopterin cofactor-binding domain-containing protein [Planctomycetota bacterium]
MRSDDFMGSDFSFMEMDFSADIPSLPLSRREFFKIVGGGIVVLFATGEGLAQEARRGRRGAGPQAPEDFNAYLRIGEDGRVTCFTGKIEMGQGVVTSLAQMLADELDVALDAVEMVMGDTDRCPWDMGTFGSMSTRFFGPQLRSAAATARAVLLELAAEKLQVDKGELVAEAGAIFGRANPARRVTFAELTEGKKIVRRPSAEAVPKAASEFKVIGKPALRVDAAQKVTGKALYAGDIRLPGMLYARILRPPAHGATLVMADTSPARQIEGVQVVQDRDLLAVLRERPDVADKALALIKAKFDPPESTVTDETIFDHLVDVAPQGQVAARGGDIATGGQLAASVVEERYLNSYVAHAAIETHTAVAQFENDRLTIWASTQTPFRLKEEAAQTLGLPGESVRVITPFVGGGFGGKTANAQGVEAARLARLTGKPVQVAWTRVEEFFYDTFRPAAVVDIKAGVTEAGTIAFWDYAVYFAGERGAPHFYDIPHHSTTVYGSGWGGGPRTHPFGTGAWRAPGNNTNTFARESHIDMLAIAAQMDPLEFRLKNLTDARMRRVLTAAAEKFGWTASPSPSGRGWGLACGIDAGTYVAHVAEVEVDEKSGGVRVKRVVCAQDMGLVINPEGAKLQMEGCITMGLGYALAEEIHFRGGDILDRSFDTYQIPRFSWLPEIETVLIEANDSPAAGGGEPAIICMGAVVANAIHDACGARLFQLPMTPARVLEAM